MSDDATAGGSGGTRLTGPDGVGELLECPVCYLQFERPLQLSCGHTFCSKCIEKLVENARPRMGGAAAFHDFLFGLEDRNQPNPPPARQREPDALPLLENDARPVARGGDRDFLVGQRELERDMDFAPHRAIAIANDPLRVPNAADDMVVQARRRANAREREQRVQAAAFNIYPFWDDEPPQFGRRGRGTNIRCPECRKTTVVPREGLPVNYRLQEMINRLTLNERNHEFNKSLDATLLRCNKCDTKLADGLFFACNDCADNASGQLCPTCAIRHHNGHTIEERRALTNDDVRNTKDFITTQAARASVAMESVDKKVVRLSTDFQSVIGETLNHIKTKFAHILLGLDDMKNLNMSMLQARMQFAEKMALAFEEFVLKVDKVLEENKKTAKGLADAFASELQGELNPFALMVGLAEIKQEPIDPDEPELVFDTHRRAEDLVGAPAFADASHSNNGREAMEVDNGGPIPERKYIAPDQTQAVVGLQNRLRQAHINTGAARTRAYDFLRPRRARAPPVRVAPCPNQTDVPLPSTSTPAAGNTCETIKQEVVVKAEEPDEPVHNASIGTEHSASVVVLNERIPVVSVPQTGTSALPFDHPVNTTISTSPLRARSPSRKRIRKDSENVEGSSELTNPAPQGSSSTPTKQSEETQTDYTGGDGDDSAGK